MPIYEYQCDKCGHEFEREQRIHDDPIKTCPHCRAPKARRLISRTSFVLKGGGWYRDLYSSARSGSKGAAKEGSPSESSSKKEGSAAQSGSKKEGSAPKPSSKKEAAGDAKGGRKGPSGGRAAA